MVKPRQLIVAEDTVSLGPGKGSGQGLNRTTGVRRSFRKAPEVSSGDVLDKTKQWLLTHNITFMYILFL